MLYKGEDNPVPFTQVSLVVNNAMLAVNGDTGMSIVNEFETCLDPESLRLLFDMNLGQNLVPLREGDRLVSCNGQDLKFDFSKAFQ